jgi:hypothetical protein
MYSNLVLSVCLAIAIAGITAFPPSPPPPSSGEQRPYTPSSPTPPSVRDALPPRHYVARNSLPLAAREQQDLPSLRVLPFRPAPPSPPLPWETPRRVDHENLAVWAGADASGRSAPLPVQPPIHPQYTNGRQEYSSPSPPVEREQFWTDGLNDVQRADAQRPHTEADQEWDDHINEAAYEGATAYSYEGATAYSPTLYERSNGYFWSATAASRGRMMLRQESRAALAASLRQESGAARAASSAAIDRSAARDCANRRQRYRRVREKMTFGDWTPEEWDQLKDAGGSDAISVSSISSASLPSLVSVSPPIQYRNPSPPPSPEPIQLQYVRDGTAGPVYALQLGPSLWQQSLRQRLVLADQLREALISPAEELTLDDHNRRYGTTHRRYPGRTATPPTPTPPLPPPPQTAVADTQSCSYRSSCQRRQSE